MMCFPAAGTASPAFTGPDGQILLPGLTVFPDHLDPRVIWVLPPALELLHTQNGDPDFFLLRYHGDFATAEGGLLRFRLGFSLLDESLLQAAADLGHTLKAVGFPQARFRLRLRSLQEAQPDQNGDWRPLAPAGPDIVAPALSLTPRETQFLEALLEDAHHPVDVELDLRYSGLVPGLPWLLSADPETLHALLAALLPAEPMRTDQVVAAFLSLPTGGSDPFRLQMLEPGATPPEGDVLRTEIALRALDDLFERLVQNDDFAVPLYRLRPPPAVGAPALAWDLLPPRLEQRNWALSWAAGLVLEGLDTPEKQHKLFPIISQVSPFAEATVHLINRVPYDSRYLRRVTVDLRYVGQAGVPEFRSFTFNGMAELQSFSVFYPAVSKDFQLAARFSAVLAPPGGTGWPVVHQGEYVPQPGLVVEITRAALGMDFVQVEAESGVFANTTNIDVMLLAQDPSAPSLPGSPPPLARLELFAASSSARVALLGVSPAAELYVVAVAQPPAADPELCLAPVKLRADRVVGRQVRISAYQLEVLEPDRITLSLDPAVAERFALVQIAVASPDGDERLFTLRAGQPATWNLFRATIFSPVRYRYHLDYVAIDSQGHTLPMASTGWTDSDETDLLVSPPLPQPEAHP